MNTDTNTYGTKGLPVFGQSAIDYGGRKEVISNIDKGFTALLAQVKTSMFPGNEAILAACGLELEKAYWTALKAIAGKHVVNN